MEACVNCGEEVQTPYCGRCGQPSPPKKLNLVTLYADFQSRIYGFDGMFPRTLRDLTLRPGKVALTYISGNRVRYVAPVGYFFLAITFFLLFMEILGISLLDLTRANNPFDTVSTEKQQRFQQILSDIISRYMRLFSFLLIPITGFFAWIFFRKQRYNLLEHCILVFYASGHMAWLSVLGLFVFRFTGTNLNNYQLIVQMFFYAFACVGFYHYQSATKVFLKGLMTMIVSLLMFTMLITTAGIIFLISMGETLK